MLTSLRAQLGSQPELAKRVEVYALLQSRRAELLEEQAQAQRDLKAWRKEHGGFKSMSRLTAALVSGVESLVKGQPESPAALAAKVTDAETVERAPTRDALFRCRSKLAALDAAMKHLTTRGDVGPVKAGVDFALDEAVALERSVLPQLPAAQVLSGRLAHLKRAVEVGSDEASALYLATLEPVLTDLSAQGESVHRAAGKPSPTAQLNQLILVDLLPRGQRLIASSKELAEYLPHALAGIAELGKKLRAQGKAPLAQKLEALSKPALEAEVKRLSELEKSPAHRALVDRSAEAQEQLRRFEEKKPGALRRFATGVVGVLDDPETWAMVAVGGLVQGRASRLILGRAAVTAETRGQLLRLGTTSEQARRLFFASNAVDGVAFHAGMNLFNMARGVDEHVDWGVPAFLRSMALFELLGGVRARHLARLGSPSLGGKAFEAVRHFGEETAALSALAVGESIVRTGRLAEAESILIENVQFLTAMRGVSALRYLHGGGRGGERETKLDKLDQAQRKALRDYQRAKTQGKESAPLLLDAYAAARRYAAALWGTAGALHAQGLATEAVPGLRPTAVSANPEGFRALMEMQAARAEGATSEHHAHLGRAAEAAFDPATGWTVLREGARSQEQTKRLLLHEKSHQLVESLPDGAVQGLLARFSARPEWTALRLQVDPAGRLSDRQIVSELVAQWNGARHPANGSELVRQVDAVLSAPDGAKRWGLDLHPDWSLSEKALLRKAPRGLFFPRGGGSWFEGAIGDRLVDRLGPAQRLAPFAAVKPENARVVWFNFELARKLGLEIGAFDQMSEGLQKKILDLFAWRALSEGEAVDGRATRTLYSDHYGLTGSGRAAMLDLAELPSDISSKGVGRTPLVYEYEDFAHTHGGASMLEGLLEASGGELANNLISRGGTRALAVIDLGDFTRYPDGTSERRALIIRAGDHLRPAHLFTRFELPEEPFQTGSFSLPLFVEAARAQGDLVARNEGGREQVDLRETMLKVLDRQAETFAEQYRWRIHHGSPGLSNVRLRGGIIDYGTFSTLKGPAPAYVNEAGGWRFGEEHEYVLTELERGYAALREQAAADTSRYKSEEIDFIDEMEARYDHYVARELLKAAGFKSPVAERLLRELPEQTEDFAASLRHLMELHHWDRNLDVERGEVDASIVDAHGLLRQLPEIYRELEPAERKRLAEEALNPQRVEDPERVESLGRLIPRLTEEVLDNHRELVEHASSFSGEYYDSPEAFLRSMRERAAFENEPISAFVRTRYREAFANAVEGYLQSGDVHLFREAVDKTVADSVRSVDGLLQQGTKAKVEGGVEVQRRRIDGLRYAVRAGEDGARSLVVRLPFERTDDARLALRDARGEHVLSPEQAASLKYCYTLDGWQTYADAPVREARDVDGTSVLEVAEIPVEPGRVGKLEGAFFSESTPELWLKDGEANYRGYTFAVPDSREI